MQENTVLFRECLCSIQQKGRDVLIQAEHGTFTSLYLSFLSVVKSVLAVQAPGTSCFFLLILGVLKGVETGVTESV